MCIFVVVFFPVPKFSLPKTAAVCLFSFFDIYNVKQNKSLFKGKNNLFSSIILIA